MGVPMTTGLPDGLDLTSDYVIQFTALNAATGAVDSGVVISNASLLVSNVAGGELNSDGFEAFPLWLDLPNTLPEPNGE